MREIFLILALLRFTSVTQAQDLSPQEIVTNFMAGLNKANSESLKLLISDEFHLTSIQANKDGQTSIQVTEPSHFFESLDKKPLNVTFDEQILDYEVKIDRDMAMVWTHYKFYLNQNFSHCGVNLFILARLATGWKILSITDTRRKDSCSE